MPENDKQKETAGSRSTEDARKAWEAADVMAAGPEVNTHPHKPGEGHDKEATGRKATDDWKKKEKP